jgi:predicted phosphodiesterase
MAIAIISDIHANLEALEAVLEDIDCLSGVLNITEKHCLGDIIGYGPDPVKCVERVQKECRAITGNHEDATCNISRKVLEGAYEEEHKPIFNPDAINSLVWTHNRIYATNPELFSYLSKLPFRNLPETAELSNIAEVHGTLCVDETEDDRKTLKRLHPVKAPHDALACGTINHYASLDPTQKDHPDWEEHLTRCFGSLTQLGRKVCFVGHTHSMGMYLWNGTATEGWEPVNVDVNGGMMTPEITRDEYDKILKETGGDEIGLNKDNYYVINPGSVGQPRDGDRRASYCIYTGDSVIFRRVPYDYPMTMFKLLSKQGLNMETAAMLSSRLCRAH